MYVCDEQERYILITVSHDYYPIRIIKNIIIIIKRIIITNTYSLLMQKTFYNNYEWQNEPLHNCMHNSKNSNSTSESPTFV